jgi:hypothetical protein
LVWQQQVLGIQVDSALLIGLGTILGGLCQVAIGLYKEHRQGRTAAGQWGADRLDKRMDGLIERQEAEIQRLDVDRDDCRKQLDEAFRQIVELRARVLEINTRWGDSGPWNERDERRIRNLLDGD